MATCRCMPPGVLEFFAPWSARTSGARALARRLRPEPVLRKLSSRHKSPVLGARIEVTPISRPGKIRLEPVAPSLNVSRSSSFGEPTRFGHVTLGKMSRSAPETSEFLSVAELRVLDFSDGRLHVAHPLISHLTSHRQARALRDRSARRKRAVLVVLLVTHKRRGKHAQKKNVRMDAQAVPILRSNVVSHAGPELPSLARGDIGQLARARNDLVGLPVVLEPNDEVCAFFDPVLVVREAHAVRGGKEARRAKGLVGWELDASELPELVKRANEHGEPPFSRSLDVEDWRQLHKILCPTRYPYGKGPNNRFLPVSPSPGINRRPKIEPRECPRK